jgi:RHS repeat-associated protein
MEPTTEKQATTGAGTRILVRFTHGLGDAVQLTVVLRHIQKYQPDWLVDVFSLRGKHSAFYELCRRSYHEQEVERADGPYATQYDLGWFENYNGYTDRPNSKVTNCLQEVFHIPYDPDLGRYQVRVSQAARERAAGYLESIGCSCVEREAPSAERRADGAARSGLCAPCYNAVLFHYQGNTSGDRKNLTHEQVRLLGLGGGVDPDTGDIYQGLDRFGRIKDLIWWLPQSTSSSSSSSGGPGNILERIQHGYDQGNNPLYRVNLADPVEQHDELYDYDGMDRLHDVARGTLNSARSALLAKFFAQCWSLDETGNWSNFREDDSGAGWDLVQNRASNTANEITLVTNLAGPGWATPGYDAAGNMTSIPQPGNLGQSYPGVYDAWGRLVQLTAGGNTLAQYQYDGLNRRIVKLTYSGGVLSQTRHCYFSGLWQPLEERLGSSTSPDRQFVWGLRHVDDLVARDRDPGGLGVLTERLYSLQDGNTNITALADSTGQVQERFGYYPYGVCSVLTPSFSPRQSSLFSWETLYAGYRLDAETGLYQVRSRYYHASLGIFSSRDPVEWDSNQYRYVWNMPLRFTDPSGEFIQLAAPAAAPAAAPLIGGLGAVALPVAIVGGVAVVVISTYAEEIAGVITAVETARVEARVAVAQARQARRALERLQALVERCRRMLRRLQRVRVHPGNPCLAQPYPSDARLRVDVQQIHSLLAVEEQTRRTTAVASVCFRVGARVGRRLSVWAVSSNRIRASQQPVALALGYTLVAGPQFMGPDQTETHAENIILNFALVAAHIGPDIDSPIAPSRRGCPSCRALIALVPGARLVNP